MVKALFKFAVVQLSVERAIEKQGSIVRDSPRWCSQSCSIVPLDADKENARRAKAAVHTCHGFQASVKALSHHGDMQHDAGKRDFITMRYCREFGVELARLT